MLARFRAEIGVLTDNPLHERNSYGYRDLRVESYDCVFMMEGPRTRESGRRCTVSHGRRVIESSAFRLKKSK